MSYTAPNWATLHPSMLRSTLLFYGRTLVSYAELWLNYAAALTELRRTLLSDAAPYWARLHPVDLRRMEDAEV